jgi:hypothetical protein
LLLPRIGLVGAAIATTVSYAAIVLFLAYQSLSVLPFKIEAVAFMRYVATGTCVTWLGTLVHMASPILNIMARGLFISALYALVLWLIDKRVRNWMRGAYEIGQGVLQRAGSRKKDSPSLGLPTADLSAPELPSKEPAKALSSVEQTGTVTGAAGQPVLNKLSANPDIDSRRETVQCT